VTLDQLQIFIAVAERQHVTRAADALGLAPPSVSAAMASLEPILMGFDGERGDGANHSSREGPGVCRLAGGAKEIRTLRPTLNAPAFRWPHTS
jgi:hypothetical protein